MKEVAFLAILAGALAFAAHRPDLPPAAIRRWNLRTEPTPLSRVLLGPVPGRPDLVTAICDYQDGWWGFFGVYRLSSGRVRWQAAVDVEPDEQSIHSIRGLQLQGFRNPIIEVFGKTHMGNGNLYLYELRDRTLVLLLTTRAVDFHWSDGSTFRTGLLNTGYPDLNGDGFSDVVLEGSVEERAGDVNAIIHSEPWRQVFHWDPKLGLFSEDVSSRAGVPEYFD
jgi:hypothetical protein